MLRSFLLLAVMLLAAPTARAQAPTLELLGAGADAITLSPQSLSGLPVTERELTFATSKGPTTARYKGVLLWDVLQSSKAFDGLKPGDQLRKSFLVSAGDGYQVVFSVGEIHPDFGNVPLILVSEIDGKPVERGWRIVVPGDKRGGRAVYEVVKIELR